MFGIDSIGNLSGGAGGMDFTGGAATSGDIDSGGASTGDKIFGGGSKGIDTSVIIIGVGILAAVWLFKKK